MNDIKKNNENLYANNFSNMVLLNTAKNCLRYVIRAFSITEIYVPYYTCPVVWQAVKKENCKVKFYHIDSNFMPQNDFNESDFILYTNYFGICSSNVKILAKRYKNLIVDNAQAFYMPKFGIASFNSLRKFLPIPDGAVLFSDAVCDDRFEIDTSNKNYADLLNNSNSLKSCVYNEFLKNEEFLKNRPIMRISDLSGTIFDAMDVEKYKQQMMEKFEIYEDYLKDTNELLIKLDEDDVLMFYPYLIKNEGLRKKLARLNIQIPQYWSPMKENSVEAYFQKYLFPLPINFLISQEDVYFLVDLFKNSYFG